MPTKITIRRERDGAESPDLYTFHTRLDLDIHAFRANKTKYMKDMLVLKKIVHAIRQFEIEQNFFISDPHIYEWNCLESTDAIQILFCHKGIMRVLETTFPLIDEDQVAVQVVFEDDNYILSNYEKLTLHDKSTPLPKSNHRITVSTLKVFDEIKTNLIQSPHFKSLAEKYLLRNAAKKRARNKLVTVDVSALKKQFEQDKKKTPFDLAQDLLAPIELAQQSIRDLLGPKTQTLESKLQEYKTTYTRFKNDSLEEHIKTQWQELIESLEPLEQKINSYKEDLAEIDIEFIELLTSVNEELAKLNVPSGVPNIIQALQFSAYEYFKHLLDANKSLSDNIIKQFNEKFLKIANIQTVKNGTHIEAYLKLQDLSHLSLLELSHLINELCDNCYRLSGTVYYSDSLKIVSNNLNVFCQTNLTHKEIYSAKKKKQAVLFPWDNAAQIENEAVNAAYQARLSQLTARLQLLETQRATKSEEEKLYVSEIQEIENAADQIVDQTKQIQEKIHRAQESRRKSLHEDGKFISIFKHLLVIQEKLLIDLNKEHIKKGVNPKVQPLNIEPGTPVTDSESLYSKISRDIELAKAQCELLYVQMDKALQVQHDKILHMQQLKDIPETSRKKSPVKLIEIDLNSILNSITLAVEEFKNVGEAAILNSQKAEALRKAQLALADEEAAKQQAELEAKAVRLASEQAIEEQKAAELVRQSKVVETINTIISTLENTAGWKNQVRFFGGEYIDENRQTKVPRGIAEMYQLVNQYKKDKGDLTYSNASVLLNSLKSIADNAVNRGGSSWCVTVRKDTTAKMYDLIDTLPSAERMSGEASIIKKLKQINASLTKTTTSTPAQIADEEKSKKVLLRSTLRVTP